MRRLIVLFLLSCASPASAQSVYVAAVAGAGSTLSARFEVTGASTRESGGTAPFVGVRVGSAVGRQWGLEVEAVHTFDVERTSERAIEFPLSFAGGSGSIRFPAAMVTTEARATMIAPAAWVRLPVTSRIDLMVTAGPAFNRTVVAEETRLTGPSLAVFLGLSPLSGLPPLRSLVPATPTTRAVTYDVGPLVGVDVAMRVGNHVRVAPGVRLSSVTDGWSIRPGVAVGWSF